MIENNFKNSAYKNVLAYEQQKQMIEDLEEQLKIAKELNLDIKKEKKKQSNIAKIKERRNREMKQYDLILKATWNNNNMGSNTRIWCNKIEFIRQIRQNYNITDEWVGTNR